MRLIYSTLNYPLDGYNTELDTSQLLVDDEIYKYSMIIGCLNWYVTLDSYDVHYETSTILRYQIAKKRELRICFENIWIPE